jgi:cell division protein FtsW (lipid II flippase)
MKVVMILFMANFLVEQEEHITKSLKGFFGALFIVGLSGALTIAETDLGAINNMPAIPSSSPVIAKIISV